MYCDFTLSIQNKYGFTIWPEEAKQKEEQDAKAAAEARQLVKQRERERKEREQAAANAAADQAADGGTQVIDTGHTPEESKNAA